MSQAAPIELFGHPRGIFVLFLVEMWERFSYYGMRALLIFYLTQHFLFSDAKSTAIYGAYTALIYGSAVAGGWLADRFIGGWRSVVWGAVLIMAGHMALIVEGQMDPSRTLSQQLFYLSLALIITGTGLFKPNSTTLVGQLYPEGGSRRTTGFYIFYVGINTGSALAALICGWLGQTYGWSYGFGAAAVGMALGLVILAAFRADLAPYARDSETPFKARVVLVPLAALAVIWALVQTPTLTGWVLGAALIGGLAAVGRYMMTAATPQENKQLRAALVLVAAASVFWSLFEQAGSSLNLFADRIVDLSLGPIDMLASQTQFFNPAYILLLSPAFAFGWAWLNRRGLEPGITIKCALGLLQVGLGFGALIVGIRFAAAGEGVSLAWLALAYLLHTTGELCLSPPSISAVTDLAPKAVSGLVMGLWYFSLSIGNFMGARVAGLTARPEVGTVSRAGEIAQYESVFTGILITAAVAAMLMALLAPKMARWTEGRT